MAKHILTPNTKEKNIQHLQRQNQQNDTMKSLFVNKMLLIKMKTCSENELTSLTICY